MISKYFSRKFILTLLITLLVSILPMTFKINNVSDSVTMLVLGILAGVGTAYGFVNVKQAQIPSVKGDPIEPAPK